MQLRLPYLALLFLLAIAPSSSDLRGQGVTVLHSFHDGSVANDGLEPIGNLIQGSDGYLYGTTSRGGSIGNGTVFKISPAGALTVLHNFSLGGGPDGNSPSAALVQGSDGNFYGSTRGDSVNHSTLFKMTPDGQLTTLHVFGPGSGPDGAFCQSPLIQASDGNFYGETNEGGANGVGTVFRMTPDGTVTILHSFIANGTEGIFPSAPLIQGSDGNLYGVAGLGGEIFRVTLAGQYSVLYVVGGSIYGGLIQGPDGNLYVTSSGGTVYRLTLNGVLSTLYTFPSGTIFREGSSPAGSLFLASDGNFYGITYSGGTAGTGTIYEITPQGVGALLHSFNDGSVPNEGQYASNVSIANFETADLVQGSDGRLYGITYYGPGGSSDYTGTIFAVKLGVPAISGPLSSTGTAGAVFNYLIEATNSPTNFSASNLPDGLSINATSGLITGTPTTVGTTTVNVTMVNAVGANTVPVTVTIVPVPVPVITSAPAAFGSLNAAFSYAIKAASNPTGYSATGLTGTGLSLNGATGVISGTPTAAGTISAAITATNSAGSSTSTPLTINITSTAPTLSQEYVVYHRFGDGTTPNDGIYPVSMIQAFDGSFYGVTSGGGTSNQGALFNMTAQGTVSLFSSLSLTLSLPDGILQSSDGSFYVDLLNGQTNYSSGVSTLARVSTQGYLSLIHSLGSNSSSTNPNDPIQAADGNYYGMTQAGGPTYMGTVYRVSQGHFTVIHTFGDGSVTSDGATPEGQLVQGPDGALYGTTFEGGAGGFTYQGVHYGYGTALKITTDGQLTILHSFGAGAITDIHGNPDSDGIAPATTLILASDGKFYGTTSGGGAYGNGMAFKMTSDGTVTSLHDFADASVPNDGASPAAALLEGYDGNFYGTTNGGGAQGKGTIFQLTPDGVETIIHSFGDPSVPNDGTGVYESLIQGTDGNIYGITLDGGIGKGTVFAILAQQTPVHVPDYFASQYGTSHLNQYLTFTPKAAFGTSGSGALTSFLTQIKQMLLAVIRPNATQATNWTLTGTSNPPLPQLLSFDSTSGTITGEATVAGTFHVTLTPQNAAGVGLPRDLTLYIDVPPTITSNNVAAGNLGTPFSYAITGTAFPSSFEATGLPAWLSCDQDSGLLSGTPTAAGTYVINAVANNFAGKDTRQITLTVTGGDPAAPALTSGTSVSGAAGTPFDYQITATNSPTSYSALLLPVGLVFDPASGLISGTPTTAGTYSVPVFATNDHGSTASEVTITIAPSAAPTIGNPLSANAVPNTAFSWQIPAQGYVNIYGASYNGNDALPDGLTLNSATGIISGTPTTAGTFQINVTATNVAGTGSSTLNLTVAFPSSTFSQWEAHYSLTGLATDEPQHDGVPNLLKYFYDIDPTKPMSAADRAALPVFAADTTTTPGTTYLKLDYRQYGQETGLTLLVQTSPDLKTWTALSSTQYTNVQTGTVTGDLGIADPTMEIEVPASGSREFLRLNFTSP